MSEFHGGQSNSPNITIVNDGEDTNDEQTPGEAEQIPKVQVLQVFPVPWDMGEVLGSKCSMMQKNLLISSFLGPRMNHARSLATKTAKVSKWAATQRRELSAPWTVHWIGKSRAIFSMLRQPGEDKLHHLKSRHLLTFGMYKSYTWWRWWHWVSMSEQNWWDKTAQRASSESLGIMCIYIYTYTSCLPYALVLQLSLTYIVYVKACGRWRMNNISILMACPYLPCMEILAHANPSIEGTPGRQRGRQRHVRLALAPLSCAENTAHVSRV